ncbi:MAG: ribonuclease D [Xanthomonadales bacterium]|nr:ribonuclease D [Xanthomonadales bacterium]
MSNQVINNHDSALKLAELACESPVWIQNPQQLEDCIQQWKQSCLLAIDTEFMRERTYYPQLALVQISDGKQVWLVDSVTLGDHQSLAQILLDPSVIKVLHSPREDLEVLQLSVGALPSPIFDTKAAAALCGLSLQSSYGSLLADTLNVHLDKEQARSDWLKRPLSPEQVAYACNDVAYLPILASVLEQQLKTLERWEWFQADMARLVELSLNPISPELLYTTISGAGRLYDVELSVLQALCQWREITAQQANLPKTFIIRNDGLMKLVECMPASTERLQQLNILKPSQIRRHGKAIVDCIRDAQSKPPPPPVPRLDIAQQQALKKAQKFLRNKAEGLRLEPSVLASRRDLERWLKDGEQHIPPRLQGWRWELLGEDLGAILHRQ